MIKCLRYWSPTWWLNRFRAAAPPVADDADEAAQWRQREEQALVQASQQGIEVNRVADSLDRHRHDNHFAELLVHAFQSGG